MDRCIQLADGFLILAEKELSAFIRAVDKLFGAEQARQSARHWIEELERMDCRLENRFQIGVGLRWAQVLGLPHCCLAVASQNLGSEEGDSCEQTLSAMHHALGSYLEESAPRRGRGSPRNGASPVCSGSSPGDAKSVIPRSRRDRAEDSGLSRASRLHR
jgi:hypothetical protein